MLHSHVQAMLTIKHNYQREEQTLRTFCTHRVVKVSQLRHIPQIKKKVSLASTIAVVILS